MSRLCMFHPVGHPMERGWVGRLDGDRVIHLAAQTLQSFFTGGGSAREHAEYPLAEVRLLAPVLHPPSIRLFEDETSFSFANPAAIVGPGTTIDAGANPSDTVSQALVVVPRIAAVIGAEAAPAAFTILAEWRDPARRAPKDRDFAFGLGPVAVTPDELDPNGRSLLVRVDGAARIQHTLDGFDWHAAASLATESTKLYPGDLLAGPAAGLVHGLARRDEIEIEVDGIGVLAHQIAG